MIVIGTYLGVSKDIPFTKPYQLKAVFENAPPIHKGQAVRIAGVEVGKVSKVEPVGGDSPAVVVTMKLEDEALPIHKDAQIKVRPRLFFEGNLFFDIRPGHARGGRRRRRRHDPGLADLGAGPARPGARHAQRPTRARTSRSC